MWKIQSIWSFRNNGIHDPGHSPDGAIGHIAESRLALSYSTQKA